MFKTSDQFLSKAKLTKSFSATSYSSYSDESDEREGGECCAKFRNILWRCVSSIWTFGHNDEQEEENQKEEVKKNVQELLVYVGFLVILCVIAFGTAPNDMFYFTKVMQDLFLESQTEDGITLKTIKTYRDFWKYANGPLIDNLYWTKGYGELDKRQEGYIYYSNKLLGVPRIRQVRMQNNSCVLPHEFKTFLHSCYFMFENSMAETGPIGSLNDSAWQHKTDVELKTCTIVGNANTYTGGGYVQNLHQNREKTQAILKKLEDNLWLSKGTRAVFVSFTVYNMNINLCCTITLITEFISTGGSVNTWLFTTFKLIQYATSYDYFILACQIAFSVYIFYYIVEELIEICMTRVKYFSEAWNVVDIFLICVCITYMIWSLFRSISINDILTDALNNPESYPNFECFAMKETYFNNVMALSVFTAWVKVFKFLGFNETMIQLSTTLNRCSGDLLGFCVVFFIVFLAFTQLGNLLFGSQVGDFRTFMNSFFTLFRIILGDFDFQQLVNANRVLGPIFFLTFVFFVFFILINMFLAIINDTYSEVKSDMAKETNTYIMTDYFMEIFNELWEKFKLVKSQLHQKKEEVVPSAAVFNEAVDYSTFEERLVEYGYTREEIESAFFRFETTGDEIDPEEQKLVIEQLQKDREESDSQKKDQDDVSEDDEDENVDCVEYKELENLVKRMDSMEKSAADLFQKLKLLQQIVKEL